MNFLKTFFVNIIVMTSVYFGFVENIVIFRIFFDIIFGFTCICGILIFISTIVLKIKPELIKSKEVLKMAEEKNIIRWIWGIILVSFVFGCIYPTFPILASWYLIVAFSIWILSYNFKNQIKNLGAKH